MNHAPSRRQFLRGTVLAGIALGSSVLAQATPSPARPLRAAVSLTETTLLDVNARRQVQLLREVMRERVIALNFFFTSCPSVCPVHSIAMARAQRLLADAMGQQVAFVSIAIDPARDTEQAMRDYARAHGAGEHWRFLRGELAVIDPLRRGFNAYAAQRDNHPPMVAVGRANAAQWSRLYGLPSGEAIADEVRAWLD